MMMMMIVVVSLLQPSTVNWGRGASGANVTSGAVRALDSALGRWRWRHSTAAERVHRLSRRWRVTELGANIHEHQEQATSSEVSNILENHSRSLHLFFVVHKPILHSRKQHDSFFIF